MSEHILEIRHLSKTFGTHAVLKDIDFTVDKGDVTSIIGASGSGKSTLLRCINLLETLTTGEILFHGQDVTAGKINPSAYRAKVGMVFQNFNLFSNLTVLGNCMIGQQKVSKIPKEEAKNRALYYLNKVGMAPYINARPDQISGGQK
ncbi:MAG: amino acid ABC transporter ATP-binding protein, partial [Clostridia bacterium]|nr:amino acid ABC transporter ATP-binding protein [Clostridia bacterium]